jgi:hypothetical protein
MRYVGSRDVAVDQGDRPALSTSIEADSSVQG